jgi:23S rRNA (uracil1939-C5)-methyltransferase
MEGIRVTALPACPHRPPCLACPRFGEPGVAPVAQGALAELARSHRLAEVPVVSGETSGFRHRARLAIRGRLGSPKVGLFELGTHRVVHIPHCSIQHPLINRVASVVRRALVDARVTSYSDAAHLGVARYLQVVVERSSQTAQVVLVANSETFEPLQGALELIRGQLADELHSLWFSSQRGRGNVILGTEFTHCFGPATVRENFGGADVHYPPGAFGQSNLEVAELLIGYVRNQIPEGARVAEFYAGVGAIGLSVLDRVSHIRMNEVNPASLQGLELGIAQLEMVQQQKISVLPGPAGAAHPAASDVDVVIVDPPRKGLDRELCERLSAEPPERLLYVSCGLESLIADAAQLTARGAMRLAALEVFNLFPFTEHAETLARFERV